MTIASTGTWEFVSPGWPSSWPSSWTSSPLPSQMLYLWKSPLHHLADHLLRSYLPTGRRFSIDFALLSPSPASPRAGGENAANVRKTVIYSGYEPPEKSISVPTSQTGHTHTTQRTASCYRVVPLVIYQVSRIPVVYTSVRGYDTCLPAVYFVECKTCQPWRGSRYFRD